MATRTPVRPRKSPPKQATKLAAPTIALVLDESGSMQRVKTATIGSYNEYIQSLQNDKANDGALYTLTRFSGSVIRESATTPLNDAPMLDDKTYQPNDGTPLLDAIARTISRIDAADPKGPVIVVVLTDGEENASQEYSRMNNGTDRLRALIQQKEATGRWTFVYLGANQDAWSVGASIGVSGGNTMSYSSDSVGTMMAMNAAASATSGITRAYAASGGHTTSSTAAFAAAGIDTCLACKGKITFGTPHVCGVK